MVTSEQSKVITMGFSKVSEINSHKMNAKTLTTYNNFKWLLL